MMPNPFAIILALLVALAAGLASLNGPDDVQAARDTAAAVHDAQAQAQTDAELRAEIDHLAATMAQGRQARHCDIPNKAWTPIELKAPEISALSNAIDYGGAQMLHLRQDEFKAAVERSKKWTDEHLENIVRKVRKQAMGDS